MLTFSVHYSTEGLDVINKWLKVPHPGSPAVLACLCCVLCIYVCVAYVSKCKYVLYHCIFVFVCVCRYVLCV